MRHAPMASVHFYKQCSLIFSIPYSVVVISRNLVVRSWLIFVILVSDGTSAKSWILKQVQYTMMSDHNQQLAHFYKKFSFKCYFSWSAVVISCYNLFWDLLVHFVSGPLYANINLEVCTWWLTTMNNWPVTTSKLHVTWNFHFNIQ